MSKGGLRVTRKRKNSRSLFHFRLSPHKVYWSCRSCMDVRSVRRSSNIFICLRNRAIVQLVQRSFVLYCPSIWQASFIFFFFFFFLFLITHVTWILWFRVIHLAWLGWNRFRFRTTLLFLCTHSIVDDPCFSFAIETLLRTSTAFFKQSSSPHHHHL